MIFDFTELLKKNLASTKEKNDLLNMKGINTCLALLRTHKNGSSNYYLNTLKRFAKTCGITIKVFDLYNYPQQAIIKEIDKLNSNPSIHGILLETPNKTLINNIIPYKDVEGTSIPHINALNDETSYVYPSIAKAIIKAIDLKYESINNRNILFVVDENNDEFYIKFLIDYFRKKNATITIANNKTHALSSLFYDKNIILVANNKPESIGYGLIDDMNSMLDMNVAHGLDWHKTLLFDMNIHKILNSESLCGNIQYNTTELVYKYAFLEHIIISTVGDFIPIALTEILNNLTTCTQIQHEISRREFRFI